jgi:serine/threonine-protein kinase mTOR
MSLMEYMREHCEPLVNQVSIVSQELIRVAILWHEMWHEGLEEASRQYFGDHNVEAMFATLAPLHEMLDKGPETMQEASFQQAFGRELSVSTTQTSREYRERERDRERDRERERDRQREREREIGEWRHCTLQRIGGVDGF